MLNITKHAMERLADTGRFGFVGRALADDVPRLLRLLAQFPRVPRQSTMHGEFEEIDCGGVAARIRGGHIVTFVPPRHNEWAYNCYSLEDWVSESPSDMFRHWTFRREMTGHAFGGWPIPIKPKHVEIVRESKAPGARLVVETKSWKGHDYEGTANLIAVPLSNAARRDWGVALADT